MLIYFKLLFILPWLQVADFHPAVKISGASSTVVDFGAVSDGKKVILNWVAGNDRSFDYFTVERSKDGINFTSAVMIKGAGKINNLVDYTDIDYSPYTGMSYYRLKQTDYSGESFYSEVVIVNAQMNKEGFAEACTGQLFDNAELKEFEQKSLLVVLKDAKGQEFISKVRIGIEGGQVYATDLKNSLNKGSYLVVASSCNKLCSQKLTIR